MGSLTCEEIDGADGELLLGALDALAGDEVTEADGGQRYEAEVRPFQIVPLFFPERKQERTYRKNDRQLALFQQILLQSSGMKQCSRGWLTGAYVQRDDSHA